MPRCRTRTTSRPSTKAASVQATRGGPLRARPYSPFIVIARLRGVIGSIEILSRAKYIVSVANYFDILLAICPAFISMISDFVCRMSTTFNLSHLHPLNIHSYIRSNDGGHSLGGSL